MEARFPFGRFAEQSQLELIYAHYMTADTEARELAQIASFVCTQVTTAWTTPITYAR